MNGQAPTSTPEGEVQAEEAVESQGQEGVEETTPGAQTPPEGEGTTPEEGAEESPDSGDKEGKSNDQFVQTVKIGEKEVPVDDLLSDVKFEIPVGDETFEFTGTEELKKYAGIGIHAAQRIRQAKDVIEEANQVVQESEAKVAQLQASVAKMADEKATQILDQLFISIQKGINPTTGEPISDAALKGAMDRSVRLAKHFHEEAAGAKPKESVEDQIKKALDERFSKQELAARNQRVMESAKTIFQKATEPYAQKFLKGDGKTVNSKAFNYFRNEVANEAARLVQGRKISAAEGERVMAQAVKNVLPDFEEFFAKPAKVDQTKKPVPIVKASGGTLRKPIPTGAGKPVQGAPRSLEELWDSRFAK